MVRKLRVEYPGAIYHVMNRGDRREPIFEDDQDHKRFLGTLEEARVKPNGKPTHSASCRTIFILCWRHHSPIQWTG